MNLKLLLKAQFVILMFLSVGTMNAQLGVGTPSPNSSAMLDVESSSKGVLIPRVELLSSTDNSTIINGNVESLLVYNTQTIADVKPGYYYWNNISWVKLVIEEDIPDLETLTILGLSANDGPDTIPGTLDDFQELTYIDEDGTTTSINLSLVVDSEETVTELGISNNDGPDMIPGNTDDFLQLTFLDEDGVITEINLTEAVDSEETVTTLVDNGDGTITYIDEDGTANIINTSVAVADGSIDITGDGLPDSDVTLQDIIDNISIIVNAEETVTTLVYDGLNEELTYTDEDGVPTVIDLGTIIGTSETLTSLVDNGDGTMTYTDEDGTANTINTTVSVADGTIDIDGDGTPDNDVTLQDIVNNINNIVDGQETVTTLVYDGLNEELTYTDEDGVPTVIDLGTIIGTSETLTSLVDNGDGTMTYTDEDGTANTINTTVSVADGTIDIDGDGTPDNDVTLQDIVNNINNIVDGQETVTTLVYDGLNEELTYTDEDGVPTVIDLGTIIGTSETLTSLVDNGDGTMTYTDEDGTANTINTTVSVADGTIDIDGDGTPDNDVTLQDIVNNINNIVDGQETVTTLVYDGLNEELTYTDEDGVPTVIDLGTIIGTSETLTSLVDNGDGTMTYTDEDGTANTINTTVSVADGTIDIDGDGTPDNDVTLQDIVNNINNIVDGQETVTTLVYDGLNEELTYTDEDGVPTVIDLGTIIGTSETLTSLVDNGDGTMTYTDEDGTANTINTTVSVADGTIDIDGDGTPDNDVTLQDIVNNINNIVDGQETVTTLVYDGLNEELTYTDEDGVPTVIDLGTIIGTSETLTSLVDNGDGTMTYTDEDGTANTINTTVSVADGTIDIDGDGTPDNDVTLQDIVNNINNIVDGQETVTTLVYDGLNEELTYTDEDGVPTVIDLGTIIGTSETLTSLVDNGDGTMTYTDEDGTANTINTTVSVADGTIDIDGDGTPDNDVTLQDIVNNINNIVDGQETVTTLVYDGLNEELTYTDEDGVPTVIDLGTIIGTSETLTSLVDNGDGTMTYTDEDGTANTINTTVSVADGTIDIDGDGTPDNDVTLQDIVNNINNIVDGQETVTTLVYDGLNEELTYTDEDGVPTVIDLGTIIGTSETLTSLVDNGDGTMTYTDEDGTANTINTTVSVADGTIDIDGDGTPDNDVTLQDIVNNINNIVDGQETVTTLVYDGLNEELTYTDEDGVPTVIDLGTIIGTSETLTSLVDNGDGTMTYTDEDGTANTINTTVSVADGTIDIDGDGTPDNDVTLQDIVNNINNIVDGQETVTTLVYDGLNEELTYTDEDGVPTVIDMSVLIGASETLTSLVDNGDGTMTYTDEDGTANTINTTVSVADGTIDIDGDGTPDNDVTLQDIVNNINNIVNAEETVTSLAYDGLLDELTYTDEDGVDTVIDLGTIIDGSETLTSLVDNGDGTMTYTDENGTANIIDTTIEVVDGSIDITGDGIPDNNVSLQDIVNNIGIIVDAEETVTTLVYDGLSEELTYTDEDGISTVIDMSALIGASETLTSLVDNGDGTMTYTDENGTANIINTTVAVADGTIDIDGDGTPDNDVTLQDIVNNITNIVNAEETVTSLAYDGLLDELTYTDEDGVDTVIDLGTIIDGSETLTSLVDNGDGTMTYTDENGTANIINTTVEVADGTIDIDGDGTPDNDVTLQDIVNNITNIVNSEETVTSLAYDGLLDELTYTDEDGVDTVIDLGTIIDGSETLTSLVDNGDGTMTYTDENGTANIINTTVAVADGTIDIDGDGTPDNDVTLQDIVNNITNIVNSEETVTSLAYDGLLDELTYTDEDGVDTVIDLGTIIDGSETLTSLVDNGDGTMTYTDENGTANIINTTVAVADGTIDIDGDGTPDNDVTLQDIVNNITNIVNSEETVTSLAYDGLLDELTYTDEDGVDTVIDLGTIIDGSETLTSLVDNGDGTMTYTDENGTANIINTTVAVADGTIDIDGDGTPDNDVTLQDIVNNITNIVNAEETVTSLAYDGLLDELTYTDEDGVDTVIDLGTIIDGSETLTSLVDNGDGTMTYTDENGTANIIDTTIEVVDGSIDITGDGIPDNNVSLQDIVNNIGIIVDAEETVTTLVYDGLSEELTYTDEDGISTVIDMSALIGASETLTSLVDNGDGTMTYTDENGTANIINTTVAVADGTIDIDGDGTPDNDVTLQDIVNNITNIVNAEETVTSLAYDGLLDELTYTDEDGVDTVIDLGTIIDGSETLTSLVDNGDGTMTYTDENGTANIINTTVAVADGTIDIDGDGTPDNDVTLQDIVNNITNIVNAEETVTSLAYDGLLDELTYTDEDGVDTVIDLGTIIDGSETLTSLVDNGDGTMTYTDENGTANIIDTTIEVVDGSIDITGDGIPDNNVSLQDIVNNIGIIVDAEETVTTLVYDGLSEELTYTDEDGISTVIDMSALIGASETLTSLVDNGDGTMTYTDENGTANIINTTVAVADGTIDIDGDGTPDNDVTLQDIVNNITNIVNAEETVTSLAYDGLLDELTYTDEDGVDTVIDLGTIIDGSETLTSLVDNGDGTMTYTDENGTANIINTTVEVADGSIDIDGDGTPDNDVTLQDIVNNITNIVNAEETVTSLAYDGLLDELTYTDEDGVDTVIDLGTIIDGSETLTSLVDNGDGTMTYTDENGTANIIDTTIEVVDGSIDITGDGIPDNNVSLQDIVNNIGIIVDAEETVTTLVYDGLSEELTYTDEDGISTVIDMSALIGASETLTSLVDNGDGTMTYTDENGTANIINTTVEVADGSIDIDGDGTPDNDVTLQDIVNNITNIVNAEETVTSLAYDGLLDELTYTDEDGVDTVIDLGTIIDGSETLTSLVDNGDGTMTYTDENGTANIINTTVEVADGSIDIDGDGTPDNDVTLQDIVNNITNIVNAEETVTSLAYDGLLDELTYTDEDGVDTVIDLGTIIDGSETLTSLVDNGDGTMTYTDENGTANIINTTVEVADGTIDIDGDGTPDNDVTLQDIVNNITNIVNAEETLTSLAYDGLLDELTYTDEDGVDTVIDLGTIIDGSETLTSLVDNGDGTMTYTDENGTANIINTTVEVADGSIDIDGDGTPDNDVTLQDIVNNITNIVNAEETVTSLAYDGLLDELTYTDEDGVDTVIDLGTIIDGSETLTSLVDNGDGTMTYTDENGTANIINTTVAVADGTIDIDGDGTPDNDVTLQDIVNNITNIVNAEETLTSLAYDGLLDELTYTDEDGVDTVIDLGTIIDGSETLTSLVDNGDGTMTYTDENGTANIINTTVAVADGTIDIDGDGTPDTNVTLQDIIDNITTIVNAEETLTSLVDNGNGTMTYTDEEGSANLINTTSLTLYTSDGTLTGNRTVNQGFNTLNFTSSGDNAFTIDGATFNVDSDVNRVGIGTNTPSVELDVNGRVRVQNIPNGANSDVILSADPSGNIRRRTAAEIVAEGGGVDSNIGNSNQSLTENRIVDLGVHSLNFISPVGIANAFSVDGNTLSVDALNNRVGIGTNSPTATLDVEGNARIATLPTGVNGDLVVTSNGGNLRSRTAGDIVDTGLTASNGLTKLGSDVRLGGALTANTTVSQGSSTLNFTSSADNAFTIDGTTFNIDANTNRVGIGTSDPSVALDLNGNARVRTIPAGAATDVVMTADGSGNVRSRTAAQVVAAGGGNLGTANQTLTANRAVTTGNFDLNVDANTLVVDGSANRVGIGTNAPSTAFDVNGNARVRTIPAGAASDLVMTADGSGNIRNRTAAQIVAAGGGNLYTANGTLTANRAVTTGNFDLNVDANTLVVDGSANRVGIGTNAPTATLDVRGTTTFNEGGGDFDFRVEGDTDANLIRTDALNSRVGIGTGAPSRKLHVQGNARITDLTGGAASDVVITADGSGNVRSRTAAQIVAAGGGVTTDTNLGNTNQTLTANRTVSTGNFDLNVDANTLVVDGSANRVGIGTNAPSTAFDVNGNARVRTIPSGAASDLVMTADGSGNIRSRTAAQIVAAGGGGTDTNLGTANQTLTANRAVTTGNFDLNVDANTLVVDGSANRVGVGTNAPSTTFDVNGNARIRTIPSGAAADVVMTADGSGNVRSRTAAQIVAAAGGFTTDTNIGNTNQTLTANRTVTTGNFDLNVDANTLVVDGSANRVGIGTNAPSTTLDVNGGARVRNLTHTDGVRHVYVSNDGTLTAPANVPTVFTSGVIDFSGPVGAFYGNLSLGNNIEVAIEKTSSNTFRAQIIKTNAGNVFYRYASSYPTADGGTGNFAFDDDEDILTGPEDDGLMDVSVNFGGSSGRTVETFLEVNNDWWKLNFWVRPGGSSPQAIIRAELLASN